MLVGEDSAGWEGWCGWRKIMLVGEDHAGGSWGYRETGNSFKPTAPPTFQANRANTGTNNILRCHLCGNIYGKASALKCHITKVHRLWCQTSEVPKNHTNHLLAINLGEKYTWAVLATLLVYWIALIHICISARKHAGVSDTEYRNLSRVQTFVFYFVRLLYKAI